MGSPRFKAIPNPKPKAVIVTCIDPRFEEAFNGLPNILGMTRGEFIHMKIGGGPIPLAYPKDLGSRYKGLAKQLEFTCQNFPITRVVLVSHEDCKYYTQCPESLQGPEKEKRDLPKAGGLMELWLPNQKIELRHARFINDGTEIVFEKIDVSPQVTSVSLEWTRKPYQQAQG